MKKTLIIFSFSALMAACGSGNDTKTSEKKDSSASAVTTTATISPEAEKALELIGTSDCKTCHKLNENDATGGPIGPMYTKVAEKYASAADTTIDRIAKKVISGGSGIWGVVPMTPHPALTPADAKTIVTYILSLKK